MSRSIGILGLLCLAGCTQHQRLGFVGGMTGRSAALAQGGRDGARLFAEQEHRTLVTCDSRGEAGGAADCVRRLARQGVQVIIGPMISAEADSALAAAAEEHVVLVSPTVSAAQLTGKDDLFLRVIGSNFDQADRLAEEIGHLNGCATLIFWETGNQPYTLPLVLRLQEDIAKFCPSSPTLVPYASGPDLRFDSLIPPTPFDAVVIAGSAQDAGLLCRPLRRSLPKAWLAGSQYAMGPELVQVGRQASEGFVLAAAAGFGGTDARRQNFRENFQARFGHPPGFAAFLAWEAAAVSRPGWDAPDGIAAKERILAHPALAPLGDTLRLDEYGDIDRRVVLHQVKGGRFEVAP